MSKKIISEEYNQLLGDLKQQVASSRYRAALSVNKDLILLYYRIDTQILEAQAKHGWGYKVIDQLSRDLQSGFPEMKGFSTRNLKYMRKFSEEYPDFEFVQQVVALRDMTKPIGLAEYRLEDALPEKLQTALPTIEELEAELSKNLEGKNL